MKSKGKKEKIMRETLTQKKYSINVEKKLNEIINKQKKH